MSFLILALPAVVFTLLVLHSLLRANRSVEQKREVIQSIAQQLFLKVLTLMGIMTIWSLLQDDVAWIWWAAAFGLVAVLASLDWQRSAGQPVTIPVNSTPRGEGPILK